MQLTLDVICEYLPDSYKIKRYGYADSTLYLDAPVLYEEQTIWEEGKLYIARADILSKSDIPQKIVLICVGRRLSREWIESNNQVLLVMQETSIFSVFNQITSVFHELESWERSLLLELSKDNDFDINRFMSIGEQKFKNPISVSDSALRIILTTDKQRASASESEAVTSISPDYYAAIQAACQLERMIKEPYLSSLTGKSNIRHYCYNLYPFGYFAGCIWISEANQPFRNSDFVLAGIFFNLFRQAYSKYMNHVGSSNKIALRVLCDILDHNMLTEEEESWLKLEPGEAWMFFKLRERTGSKHLPKDYMCAMINAILPDNAFAVLHNNVISGLWKCREETSSQPDPNMQAFQNLLVRMEYTAGFSNKFTKIRTIGDQVLEAGFVINEFVDSASPVFFFRDCILHYWLGQCESRLPITEFFSDGIQNLRAYDKKKNTQYMSTLCSYVNHQGNVSETARELYISRSSMIKRLDKIKRLLNSDLTNPDELLYYSILFRLL